VKELKVRESRVMGDCAELEDENISLQKQLMHLKQAQVIMQLHQNCLRSCTYIVFQKNTTFYFNYNFVDPEPILIIFGRVIQ